MRLNLIAPCVLALSVAAFEASAQPASSGTPAQPTNPPPAAKNSSGDATAAAPSGGAPAEPDKPKREQEEEDDFKPFALTLNPLSLILTRIGLNAEYLPVKHHALTFNPYFQSVSVEVGAGPAASKTSYTTFGAELGYRFYTGSRGANGFFLGPAVFVQNTSQEVTVSGGAAGANASSSVLVYGALLDVGGQHVFKNGFTIGGGAGVMYLVASGTTGASSDTVKLEGVLPRFLFTVGYSF